MTYCFDIDGTILYSELVNGSYRLKGANLPLIEKINYLFSCQHEIILHTGRHWNHLGLTKNQLQLYGVHYTTLVMGKPVADFYIDDKALRPNEF
jgi:hydroxymethylpyrimidine pyrophosphatase-like HAD family hydrolase